MKGRKRRGKTWLLLLLSPSTSLLFSFSSSSFHFNPVFKFSPSPSHFFSYFLWGKKLAIPAGLAFVCGLKILEPNYTTVAKKKVTWEFLKMASQGRVRALYGES